MSWREESTFKKTSALTDEEKEYLKLAKKLRDVLKLEERAIKGETLESLQQEKVSSKGAMLKEVTALAVKLPPGTDVLAKNQDISDLLPRDIVSKIGQKREQEQIRREKKEIREAEERKKPEFMCRHDRPIRSVVASKCGKYLFTCSKDKYVICWSLKDKLMSAIVTFAGHTGAVWDIGVTEASNAGPCRLISGSADGKVKFWNGDPTKHDPRSVASPTSSLDHGGILRVLRWCPFDDLGDSSAGRRFASASEKLGAKPAMICVWRVPVKGQPQQVLQLDQLPTKANDLQWGGGAKIKLFSAHDNGYVGVWAADGAGSLLKTIKLHAKPVSALCLANNGATLVTSSHDSTACVVDITQPSTPTLTTYKTDRPLNAVCVTSDFAAGERGLVVVAGGRDERDVTTSKLMDDEFDSKVMDAASSEVISSGTGHFGPVHMLLNLPHLGKSGAFASVAEDGCLRVHEFNGRLLHSDKLE
jgi:WD40 repeat protein